MSKYTFFPYQAFPGEITLKISSQDPQLKDCPPDRVPAYKSATPELTFDFEASIPAKVLTKSIASQEQGAPPVEVRLVLQGIQARQRQSTHLYEKGEGYQRTVTLRKCDWCGTVQAQAFLVRTVAASGLPNGFAGDRGAILASSETVEILFDEPVAPPTGGLLNIQWVDFTQSELPWLKRKAQDLFALDINVDPPALLLNRGLPGAYQTLSVGGYGGGRARVRDLTFGLIVHQVWTSLLGSVLTELVSVVLESGGDPPDLGELRAWAQSVIMDWVQELFPEYNKREEALLALYEMLRSPSWTRDLLLERVPQALQERYKTGHRVAQAVMEVLDT